MQKVYFYPMQHYDEKTVSRTAKALLAYMIREEGIQLADRVPFKVHFGEKGNETYIRPGSFDGVMDLLEERGVESLFIETNVLYRGSRTTRQSHKKIAKEHGFTRLPIVIADGDHGEDYMEVPLQGEYFDKVKIGKAYGDYDQFIVLAHFKGHEQAGFGGAVKQLAMGFAARGGKLDQHANIRPFVVQQHCICCGDCQEVCGYEAITIEEAAFIDSERCVGCAACIATCPVGTIKNEWSDEGFLQKLAEYAAGAAQGKENLYLNFAFQITEFCDCVGQAMDYVASDIGLLASVDPVALDTACLDLLQKAEERALFNKGRISLAHAEKMGLGSRAYDLVQLSAAELNLA